jgi:large repetitive protein
MIRSIPSAGGWKLLAAGALALAGLLGAAPAAGAATAPPGAARSAAQSTPADPAVTQMTISSELGSADYLAGRPGYLIASVESKYGTTEPTAGTIVFTIDGVAQPPISITQPGPGALYDADYFPAGLTAGTHTIGASYSGGDGFAPSSAATYSLVVNPGPTITYLQVSPNPAVSQWTVSVQVLPNFTPTVDQPTGTVTILVNGNPFVTVALVDGAANQLVFSGKSAYTITATYNGDADNLPSTSQPVVEVVPPLTANVAIDGANPAQPGEAGLDVSVSPGADAQGAETPTGTVTLVIDAVAQAPVALVDGSTGDIPLPQLAAGAYSIKAEYSGDGIYSSATSELRLKVLAPAQILVESQVNPATYDQIGFLVALVGWITPPTINPTGEVLFTDNATGVVYSARLIDGEASLPLAELPVGTLDLTVFYSGDKTFAAGPAVQYVQTVLPATTSTSISVPSGPVNAGSDFTIKSTVSAVQPGDGFPSGTVVFTIDGVAQAPATLTDKGKATLTVAGLAPGVHTITATYPGSADYLSSTSSQVTVTVGS